MTWPGISGTAKTIPDVLPERTIRVVPVIVAGRHDRFRPAHDAPRSPFTIRRFGFAVAHLMSL